MKWLTEFKNALAWGNRLRSDLFKTENLRYLLWLAIMASLTIGLLLFVVDPSIRSPLDGIWSAWVTMTHVGFGDVVPVSLLGRILAAVLILFGVLFFSLFTAFVSATLIGINLGGMSGNIRRIEQEASDIQSGEERILKELARLHERLDKLENRLSDQDMLSNQARHDIDG